MKRTVLAALLAVTAMMPSWEGEAQDLLSGQALIDELAKGGYVIYMRHTKTDRSQRDSDVADLSDCSTQRNLNNEGKEQARRIGDAFRQFGIAVDEVFSSPYCRAVDTATLMLGRAILTPDLRYLTRLVPADAAAASQWLGEALAAKPAGSNNRILIAHTANLKTVTGIWPRNAGDINVFEPHGDGTYTHIGTILVNEWPDLMRQRES